MVGLRSRPSWGAFQLCTGKEVKYKVDKLSFTVSEGHGEYVLDTVENVEDGLVVSSRLDVTVEVLRGVIEGDLRDAGWPDAVIDGSIVTVDGHDYDVAWESFAHWYGPRETIEQWLQELLDEVMKGPFGADDDTFDYWPSGVRYCRQVAAHLGGDWPQKVDAMARNAIHIRRPEFEVELLNSVGLD